MTENRIMTVLLGKLKLALAVSESKDLDTLSILI